MPDSVLPGPAKYSDDGVHEEKGEKRPRSRWDEEETVLSSAQQHLNTASQNPAQQYIQRTAVHLVRVHKRGRIEEGFIAIYVLAPEVENWPRPRKSAPNRFSIRQHNNHCFWAHKTEERLLEAFQASY